MESMDHSKISPTARITAYWRSLSDISFSKEVAAATGAEQAAKQMLGDKMALMASFSPVILEARYKAIDQGLKKSKVANVLELACGLSPRGLELASGNRQYVGTDLPDILAESYPVIKHIAGGLEVPAHHLHFQPANVLDKEQLASATEHFKGERFGVCNEGLLMYLNKEEKATMAKNVRDLLTDADGCWVTTDIVFTDIRRKLFDLLTPDLRKNFESVLGNLSTQVGRDIAGNDFTDEDEAIIFYSDLGFNIEEYPFYDGSYRLSTLYLVPEEMREVMLSILTKASIWILTPKKD